MDAGSYEGKTSTYSLGIKFNKNLFYVIRIIASNVEGEEDEQAMKGIRSNGAEPSPLIPQEDTIATNRIGSEGIKDEDARPTWIKIYKMHLPFAQPLENTLIR